MKKVNWITLATINLLWVIAIIIQFLPGPPNRVVIVLSSFAQMAGFFGLLLLPVGVVWTILEIRKLKDRKPRSIPFYLVTIPLIALITNSFLTKPISDYSRDYAIKRSETLVASIEEYKRNEGQYPESLHSLKEVPSPFVMGILNFRYNKINESYTLSFSQWLEFGSLEVIVLYDKNNVKNNLTGELALYDYSFDLCRIKGAFASHDAEYGWRYYLID
jgi:hypothetical protein